MKLSVLMPIYNERDTIREIIRRVQAVEVEKEIICVDDYSTDGTREILQELAQEYPDLKLLFHPKNMGKGAAVRTGLAQIEGDVAIVQDADLEYDPQDYVLLLRPILSGKTEVVYGSRFLGEHKAMYFWHSLGNNLLTLLTNILYDTTLTDMETGYKVFTRDVARKIKLTSPRWGFDPEITSRILKLGYRIYEIPISYAGREFNEGKKISWKDGFTVLFTLVKCRFFG
ncbi:MAG: glycosyltransferase family 2 protein [Dehalococcoidia bacterium]|nr:glycosyltransferase family 2 protein [Dehalococcoidia bacterium]